MFRVIQYLLLFILVFNDHELNAQKMDHIQTDRPDQTECPNIVPHRYIQMENGFSLEKINSKTNAFTYPSSLLKYGLNDKFEIRLVSDILSIKENNTMVTGVTPIAFGFKTSICKEIGMIPLTSFIGHWTTSKFGHPAFHTKYFAPSFRFTMQHTLSKNISLGYNLGCEWDGDEAEQIFIYTLTTGFKLTEKLGGYVEFYGHFQNQSTVDNRFDGGLTYLISDDFMVYVSSGFGLMQASYANFISIGFSFRFKTVN